MGCTSYNKYSEILATTRPRLFFLVDPLPYLIIVAEPPLFF